MVIYDLVLGVPWSHRQNNIKINPHVCPYAVLMPRPYGVTVYIWYGDKGVQFPIIYCPMGIYGQNLRLY